MEAGLICAGFLMLEEAKCLGFFLGPLLGGLLTVFSTGRSLLQSNLRLIKWSKPIPCLSENPDCLRFWGGGYWGLSYSQCPWSAKLSHPQGYSNFVGSAYQQLHCGSFNKSPSNALATPRRQHLTTSFSRVSRMGNPAHEPLTFLFLR